MRDLVGRAEAIAARRAAQIRDAIADDVPSDLAAQRLDDGVAIRGPGLVRRLAFDGRLRGLIFAMRSLG